MLLRLIPSFLLLLSMMMMITTESSAYTLHSKVSVTYDRLAESLRPKLLERFKQEQQLLATLEHPSIGRLYDGGLTAQGQPYLVMEYVSGQRIDQFCRDNALSILVKDQVCEPIAF